MSNLLTLALLVTFTSTRTWSFVALPTATSLTGHLSCNAFFTAPLHQLHALHSVETAECGAAQAFSVEFPCYRNLMDLRPGDGVASPTFQAMDEEEKTHNFCVLLHPRGHNNSKRGNTDQRVGIYLQYLPQHVDSTVDATFTLLLKGQQKQGPRFDVEWSSGMRFVSPDASHLGQGKANHFGDHVMQTQLLPLFLGVQQDDAFDAGKLQVQVSITIHPRSVQAREMKQSSLPSISGGIFPLVDIRQAKGPDGHVLNMVHDTERVRVGKIVVPVLQRLSQRPRMFEVGAYPGVEYRIMRIFHPSGGRQIFESVPGADYELKPIYPLVEQLEREWPVRVNEAEIPKLLTCGMYNAISAIGSLFTAIGGLATAFVLSQAISIFFIPSKSMSPTLSVGDVLLVEKVTPRILGGNKRIGDVVLFSPPSRLREIVSSSGGRITDRDLFVKRIAAGPGDVVSVDASGAVQVNNVPTKERRDMCDAEPLRLIEKYIQPGSFRVQDRQVVVLGDCSSVSIDSRVWGPLTADEIVGRPLFRMWPLERMGPVPSLPTRSETDWIE